MERNGNTGGNNKSSDFEDIMREGGVSDEFTPPSLDAGHTGPLRHLSDTRS